MSRSRKPTSYAKYGYRSSNRTFLKYYRVTNNRRVRHLANTRLLVMPLGDDYDEKKLNLRKVEHFDYWDAF